MTLYYDIAGITFQIYSKEPLFENWQSRLFQTAPCRDAPDLACQLNLVDVLPQAEGTQIGTDPDTLLFLDDKYIYQQTIDHETGLPKLLSRYSRDFSTEIELWGLRRFYPHVGRLQVLWSAMDLPYLLLQRKILTLHSASVEVNGQAILFLAPSGTGKSTQACLWNECRGVRQLNGDKNCLGIRGDTVFAFGTPFSGTSEICTNYAMPARAIVLLGQARENSIRRLTGVAALGAILQNCFGHRGVPGCTEKMLEILAPVLEQVPVYSLACTPDERAVITLENQLRKDG